MTSIDIPDSEVRPVVMSLYVLADTWAPAMLREMHRKEIERAIDNVKRSELDKWIRREFYKADARSRWSARRRAAWAEKQRRLAEVGR